MRLGKTNILDLSVASDDWAVQNDKDAAFVLFLKTVSDDYFPITVLA